MLRPVLAPDVEMVDIDGTHWANWIRLLLPPGVQGAPRWALVFVDGTEDDGAPRIVKAIDVGRGSLDPDDLAAIGRSMPDLSQASVARLRDVLEVGAVVVLDARTVADLCADIESHLVPDEDYVAQGLTVLRALKRWSGKGLWTEPHLLELLPTPSYEALQRTFDLLIPDRSALLAYVMEDGGARVHASIIATKRRGSIDLVTTHLGVADALAETTLARDWRTQYKRLLRVTAERYEKPALAVFLERETFYRVLTGPTDQLAREINARNLIIDPAPTWLLGLLGGATVAAFASRGAKALASMLPASARRMASDLAQSAQSAMRESGAHPFALLGFDPIELWLNVRHFYRRR
jgi:hypothetical protein